MKEFKYNIRTALLSRLESPASLGAKFLKSIDTLNRIDSTIFANWEVMDFPAVESLPLTAARPRIAAIIENNVARDDLKEPEPYRGYTAGAFTDNANGSRNVNLRIATGGQERGSLLLEFGRYRVPADPAMLNYPLFKSVLLALDAIWPPIWACAQALGSAIVKGPVNVGGVQGTRIDSIDSLPGDPTFPYSVFHIPWIVYLSAQFTAGLRLPPEIPIERTPDGGCLMIATKERLDPNNLEHVRRARILAEALIKQTGYSSDYGRL